MRIMGLTAVSLSFSRLAPFHCKGPAAPPSEQNIVHGIVSTRSICACKKTGGVMLVSPKQSFRLKKSRNFLRTAINGKIPRLGRRGRVEARPAPVPGACPCVAEAPRVSRPARASLLSGPSLPGSTSCVTVSLRPSRPRPRPRVRPVCVLRLLRPRQHGRRRPRVRYPQAGTAPRVRSPWRIGTGAFSVPSRPGTVSR